MARADLTIGVTSIPDSGDLYGVLGYGIEEYAVVTTAKSETGHRRFQSLYIACAAGQVAVNAMENQDRGLTVYGAQITVIRAASSLTC